MAVWRSVPRVSHHSCFLAFCLGCSLLLLSLRSVSFPIANTAYDGNESGRYTEVDETITSDVSRVLVLTYQRCGSSFLGQLFDRNPEAFYVYEPLDALYVSLYATEQGYNVPTDISTYWNGTERIIPEEEISAQTSFLRNLLDCEFDKLPVEFFAHNFWYMFARSLQASHLKYKQCLESVDGFLNVCHVRDIKAACPQRLGQNWRATNQCADLLSTDDITSSVFWSYRSCLEDLRERLAPCMEELRQKCVNSTLRVVKTVRAPMIVGERLLEAVPDLRLVHLARDPRGVARSRMKHPSFRGHASNNMMRREARFYCRDVVRDVAVKEAMSMDQRSRIKDISYEDYSRDTLGKSKEIYRFIRKLLPNVTSTFVEKNSVLVKNSAVISEGWKDELTYRQASNIQEACTNFYKAMNVTPS